nr:helix-turn-helix domain-containing protein [Thioalkalivibrio sulfidiphilus]
MSDTISSRFREERVRLGLSQAEVAGICGVRREIVGRWERGINAPGGEALAAFGMHGADLHYILTGRDKDAPQPVMLRPDELELVLLWRDLTEEQRKGIRAQVRALAALRKGRKKT